MDKLSYSKDRSTTIDAEGNKYQSSRFATLSNRSPSDFYNVRSVKNSDYYTASPHK